MSTIKIVSMSLMAGVLTSLPVTTLAEPVGEDGASKTFALEEVVVTAQRREQNLRDVPIAISLVSEERMESAHITTTEELTFMSPSLNVVSAQGLIKPFLRGVGSQGAIAGIEMPVAIYQDGVYIAAAPAPMFGFTDIQQVEVVKGPQGTLFGRNATGGLISITSRNPTEEFEVSTSVTLADYDTREADIFLGGGLSDGVRGSIYARFADQDEGFGNNRATGEDTYGISEDTNFRGKLLFEPTENTDVELGLDYVHRDSTKNTVRFYGERAALNPVPLSSAWDTDTNVEPVNDFEGGGAFVRVDHDLDGLTFTSLSAYRESRFDYSVDVDLSPIAALSASPKQNDRQFSQEFQLSTKDGEKIDWLVGLFYFDSSADLNHLTEFSGPISPLPTTPQTRTIISSSSTESYAIFGQADYYLTDRTTLTVGLRYTIETRGFDATQNLILNNGLQIFANLDQEDIDYEKLTWRAAIAHDISDDTLVYFSYNRGFKSGGFNPTVPTDPAYKPEEIDAYELGFRSELASTLRVNGAAFFYDYSDMQVSTFRNGVTGIYNGAASDIWGIEAGFDWALSSMFSLTAEAAYLDSEYTDFKDGIYSVRQANGGYAQLTGQDLTGNSAPNSPEFTMSIGGDLHFDTSFGSFNLNANWYYNDGYYTEADNVLEQPNYDMINLSAKWEPLNSGFYLQLWAKNVLDEEVTTQNNATPLGAAVGYQPPRMVGLTFGYNSF